MLPKQGRHGDGSFYTESRHTDPRHTFRELDRVMPSTPKHRLQLSRKAMRFIAQHWATACTLVLLAACGDGTDSLQVTAPTLPTTGITVAASDSPDQPGDIARDGTTNDTTPTLQGTLSAVITSTQRVTVYDGNTPFEAQVTVSGTSWTFTPTTPLAAGSHSFTAVVGDGAGNTGTRSAAYVLSIIATPGIASVMPTEAMRTVPTTFTVAGRDLPTTGITVTLSDDTDARATCDAPTGLTATGFTVVCTLYKFDQATDAQRKLVISAGGKALGTHTVSIQSNITDVTWAAPSTGNVYGKATVNFNETVTFKATGTRLLADTTPGFAVDLCGTPHQEVGTPTDSQRTFTCLFSNGAPGAAAGQQAGVVQDQPGGGGLYRFKVPVAVAPTTATGKLPDTGITAAQCYAAGSDALVSCTSAAAIALNNKQDGMVGRDVTEPTNTDGKLGFSYSAVGAYSKEECVKDNITGLTWEGIPTSGPRAATDTVSYVAAVNAAKLCGYSDWRLPTANELQTLVDYSVAYHSPTIDGTWFPNTRSEAYLTSTGLAGYASRAWSVYFDVGGADNVNYGGYDYVVRLVR